MGNTNEPIKFYVPDLPEEIRKQIYQYPDSDVQVIAKEEVPTYILDHFDFTKGIDTYMKDASFPRKGFPTPSAFVSVNYVKSVFIDSLRVIIDPVFIPTAVMFLCLPFKRKIKFIEKALIGFNRLTFKVMRKELRVHRYLTPIAQELFILVKVFLVRLGINEEQAIQFAEIFCHLIEYDDAYRFRLQDIFNEVNQESLLTNPRKELKRVFKIYKERDSIGVAEKFSIIYYLLLLVLLSPKIRSSFKEVVKVTNFSKLRFDEADHYWVSVRGDYKFFGKTFEERVQDLENKGLLFPQAYIVKST